MYKRQIRQIANTPAMKSVIESEISPGKDSISDKDIMSFVRQQAWTVFHPCSTCRMGKDPNSSVVDPNLRVHGIDRLRIADASVFPSIPTGNINAPSIMVGERASDIILKNV